MNLIASTVRLTATTLSVQINRTIPPPLTTSFDLRVFRSHYQYIVFKQELYTCALLVFIKPFLLRILLTDTCHIRYSLVNNDLTLTTAPNSTDEPILDPTGVDTAINEHEIVTFQAPIAGNNATSDLPNRPTEHLITQSLIQFISRPWKGPSVQWKPDDSKGKVIMGFDPLLSVLSRQEVWNKMLNYKYFKCSVRIRFQVTGNLFLGGKLRAYWVPNNRTSDGFSITTVTGILQAVDIYPTENGTYSFEIPMLWPYKYFDMGKFNTDDQELFPTLGSVELAVISSLQSEDLLDRVHITPFIELIDFSFADVYTPVAYSKPPSKPTWTRSIKTPTTNDGWRNNFNTWYDWNHDGKFSILNNYDTGVSRYDYVDPTNLTTMVLNSAKTQTAIGASVEGMVKQGTSSLIGGLLSAIATPFVAPIAALNTAVSAIYTGVNNVAHPQDKPLTREIPKSFQNKWVNLAQGDGASTAQSASLLSANGTNPHSELEAGVNDETTISYLCSIPQLLANASISASDSSMKHLITWAVCPANTPVSNAANHGLTRKFCKHSTYSSFVADSFEYWKGDFVVDVEVVAQGPSKCSIGVSWIPGENFSGPNAYPDIIPVIPESALSLAYTTVINVSGTTRGQLKIPFNNSNYALSTDLLSIYPRQYSLSGTNVNYYFPTHNGFVIVYLINTLTSFSPSGANTKPVEVLMYGSWRNIEFYKPSISKVSTHIYSDIEEHPQVYTGQFTRTRANIYACTSNNLVEELVEHPEMKLDSHTEICGEQINSIYHLCRRAGVGAAWRSVVPVTNGTDIQKFSAGVRSVAYSFYRDYSRIWRPFSPSGLFFDTLESKAYEMNEAPQPFSTSVFGRMSQDVGSFLKYYREIYLASRGDVIYTFMQSPKRGTRGEAVDTGPVLMSAITSNTPAFDSNITGVAAADALLYVSLAGTLADGAVYRSSSTPANPPQISIPYYSNIPIQMSPLIYENRANFFSGFAKPGVNIVYNTPSADNTINFILEEAGDNFTYSFLYPPPNYLSCNSVVAPPGLNYAAGVAHISG